MFDTEIRIGGRHVLIPTRPLWLGLILNCVLFTVAIVVLSAVALHWRSDMRAEHGRCYFCGYALEDLPSRERCPECGKPQVKQAQG